MSKKPFLELLKMAAISVKVTSIVKNDGTITVTYDDGSFNEYPTATALSDFILGNQPNLDTVRAMNLALYLAKYPLMDTPGAIEGKVFTYDPENPTPIKLV